MVGIEDNDSSTSSSEEEVENNHYYESKIDFRTKVMEGSFLPAMALLQLNKISVEDLIEPT